MHQCGGVGERINSYALVSYVPGRLGAYLDRMRRELVSSCCAQSHITILPPRTIFAPESAVLRRLHGGLDAFSRFLVSRDRDFRYQPSADSVKFSNYSENRVCRLMSEEREHHVRPSLWHVANEA